MSQVDITGVQYFTPGIGHQNTPVDPPPVQPVFQDAETGQLIGAGGLPVFATGLDLSGVTYDGSSRCTGFTLNGIDYEITGWGSSSIVVSASDGSSRTISLDGSGRISGVI